MKNSPLVSIIVPNYNHAPFLRQRIESILEQTFSDFELIILDDCSTDNSWEIIQEYAVADSRIFHIEQNEKNSGSPFLQWKKGFSMARGKYIWIAESDDYASSLFLEKIIPLLEADSNNNIAFSGSYLVDQDGNKLAADWDRNKQEEGTTSLFEALDFLFSRMLISDSLYNASMVVFRKSSLKSVDDNFLSFRYAGDWMFFAQLCSAGNVIRYNGKLNYFRQHAAKVSPKGDAQGLRYTEGKKVIGYTMDKLSLRSIQRKIVAGKQLNDILRFSLFENESVRQMVLNDVKEYFGVEKYYVTLYRIDKILNFSGLSLRKNKYI